MQIQIRKRTFIYGRQMFIYWALAIHYDQKANFGNVISSTGKSLVFPLIYFHVNEQWTAKPIRHTRQPISSASYKHERTAIKRSRSNSTKNDDSKGKLFPYFHVKPFIVTFCRICLWNKRNLYIPIGAAWSCLLQFSRFVFWFRDLFLVELTDMPWSRMFQIIFISIMVLI